MLANFLDSFILALIEDDLVLFEQVAALSVDGNDQGAKLFNVAVPQSFRHTEVTPLGLDDLLHLGGSHNGVTGRENTVDGTELLAGALGVGAHAALAHDDADTGLLHELILELLHTHGGGGAHRHHLELVVLQRANDGAGMEDDLRACKELHKKYPATVLETGTRTPMEIKSIIASMDVFTGARMHATIAAFSSGVATIPFSYSRKFEGLYHDLGYEYLISGASTNTQEAVKKTLEWVKEYKKLRENVNECRKSIPDKQRAFLDAIKNM